MRIYRAFLLFLLSGPFWAFAQGDLRVGFREDSVSVQAGETFTNKLLIFNPDSTSITLVKTKGDAIALMALPDTLVIAAGSTASFPVKYLAAAKNLAALAGQVSVTYTLPGQTGPGYQAAFKISAREMPRVYLSVSDPLVFVDPADRLATVRLQLINKGYQAERISLQTAAFPENIVTRTNQATLTLLPGETRSVTVECRVNGQLNLLEYLTISAWYADGSLLSLNRVKTLVKTSSRTFGAAGALQAPDNSVEFTGAFSSPGLTYQMLMGGGKLELSGDRSLDYRLNGVYDQAGSSLDVRDTYLELQGKQYTARLGNIYEFDDVLLYGRGAKVSFSNAHKDRAELYYVNNSALLYSTSASSPLSRATFGGALSRRMGADNSAKLTLMQRLDPLLGQNASLALLSTDFRIDSANRLKLSSGFSVEHYREAGAASGYSGELSYTGKTGKFLFNLLNYYGSPSYSGARRGALQLNNQVRYQASEQLAFGLLYSNYRNAPVYPGQFGTAVQNGSSHYEFSLRMRFSALSVGFRPYFQQQDVNSIFAVAKLSSVHLAGDAQLTLGRGHSLAFSADRGTATMAPGGTGIRTTSLNLSYSGSFFGLNGFAQLGPDNLLSDNLQDTHGQRTWSVSPYLNFNLLKQRLQVTLSDYLSFENGTSRQYFNGSATYGIAGNIRLTARQYINSTAGYNSTQFQFGIQKNFSGKKRNDRKVRVTLFGDLNANGVFDKGESAIPDAQVMLSGLTALTDEHGRASFSKVPVKEHDLAVHADDWTVNNTDGIDLKRNVELLLPAVKNVELTGRIVQTKGLYLTEAASLSGIRVTAKAQNGNTYFGLTGQDGTFTISLPASAYILTIETPDPLIYSWQKSEQKIAVTGSGDGKIEFSFENRSRSVIVKSF